MVLGLAPIVLFVVAALSLTLTNRGRVVGSAGLFLVVLSWAGIGVGTRVPLSGFTNWAWTIAILGALPCAILAGILAGWKNSKLWYFVAAAAILTEVVLVADVMV